ncbi:MAG: hypothetical protein EOS23_26685 [Mesorhizobium sp.]|nr:MAG: hypothetical protein EOS23_26685 [Mesorhizobium sp.]
MAGEDESDNLSDEEIDVTPTRALFVEMLTRDIRLDRAVLDLVDNSIDGAKRLRPGAKTDLSGLEVRIDLDGNRFKIGDNCGGIGIYIARHYAFRFGRAKGMTPTPGSVGQFGVGMKRALFKFGHSFEVKSTTSHDRFHLKVDVDAWEHEPGPWRFVFNSSETDLTVPVEETGTTIEVAHLRDDVKAQFGSVNFRNGLGRQIEAVQQQYIDRGLRIVFDGKTLLASPWQLLRGQGIEPMFAEADIDIGSGKIKRRIFAGVGRSSPQEAGWYVFCNGRMILAADQSRTTGWERGDDDQGVTVPKFHGQFARFRGYVFLDAEDASLLPWNTTKTGVDEDTDIWRNTYAEMRRAMRPIIDFLNKLAAESENPVTQRPLTEAMNRTSLQAVKSVTRVGPFLVPQPPSGPKPPPWTSIQFSRLKSQVDELKTTYEATSNSELGGMLFDEAYKGSVT